ncbi:4-hydroxybutyryl-CoA dehydratase [Metallosphaera tengchongensis]|uniref:4-hydroxybutyryl-CoA dehydratase n=1 Tax=Metallosphaera tengchongensis TaxID=1532350 RepID=A0A6N0P0C7_9CREN|nr:4-hydroxyphenylacetate 3-hydroxylase N-terminal domain-containing protein [Metallosphaera tengchongensis]QKR00811.1 4-hydroxybutyryl-CoA dehydratase [Metallosphaera tengchongensis]
MRTKGEFIESLRDKRKVYYRGKLVDVTVHPTLRVAVKHASKLFEYGERISEGRVSKFFTVPRNSRDLLDRHELIYGLTMYCNGVFNISQAIGTDALFALMVATRKLDREVGTDYFKRLSSYFDYVSRNDLTMATAQTDVKGNRSKRPGDQEDPDMYLRVTEVNEKGIRVRGAKAHTTQGAVSNEIIVIPTRAMREGEGEYSIAFAVPADAEGLKMYVRPIDELEGNSSSVLSREDYELETLTVFQDVFVPWDRVFLFKETKYSGIVASLFATFHRFTAVSYRIATSNLFLGASRLMALANGILNEKQVRDEIVDIVMYKEVMKATAIAAAMNPIVDEEVAIPNPTFTNVGKLYSNAHFHDIVRDLIDISGGIISTMPSEEDLSSPEGEVISKYLRGAVDGKERVKLLKIAKELGSSHLTGYLLTLMVHAEGSMEASKIELSRSYNYKDAEDLVRRLTEQEG